jgi:hypothetical protein
MDISVLRCGVENIYCVVPLERANLNHSNITITVLDIINHPFFYFKTKCFGEWILSPSSGATNSVGTNR